MRIHPKKFHRPVETAPLYRANQQILADHAGGVRVAQTGPTGTRFELTLPACAPTDAALSSQPHARPRSPAEPDAAFDELT